MIKKLIKTILGEYWIFRLKELKGRINNSKYNQSKVDTKLYLSFIKKGDLCFDVGANVGNKVEALLSIGARVVAVEPQKSCVKILKYKFRNKISIVNKGLGEAVGVQKFHISDSSTISSFSKDWIDSVQNTRFKTLNWKKVMDMEMTTLDELILEYGKPFFIKIDVEGYELEVLKGLNSSVQLISFEYTVPERTNRLIECLDYLDMLEKNAKCNYTKGENMQLELEEWISIDDLKKHIASGAFPKNEFGDIYITTLPM